MATIIIMGLVLAIVAIIGLAFTIDALDRASDDIREVESSD